MFKLKCPALNRKKEYRRNWQLKTIAYAAIIKEEIPFFDAVFADATQKTQSKDRIGHLK